MPQPPHDVVLRGGTLVTAAETVRADIGIRGGQVAAIGTGLGPGLTEIDATGRLVMPGGVDAHCHIEQISGAGVMNADTFETATRSAALGGTTSVISFAAQHPGMRLRQVVDDYAARAARGAIVDHAFHMIVADPDAAALGQDLPALIAEGHRSIKIFTTYDKVRLGDEQILDLLDCARAHGALVCIHAENDGMIRWMTRRLLAAGLTAPRHHALSHPRMAEVEALERMIRLSAFIDQPIVLFHVSTAEGAAVVARARAAGLKVFAETCPHYLFMTAAALDLPGIEGAKLMCSPPQRTEADQEALWRALAAGDLQYVSSDHAPYRFDATGKLSAGPAPGFDGIANGMPGLELRQALMFDAMVSKGRLGPNRFVELTSTAPARLYDLPGKGTIAIGADADIVLWDPERRVVLGENDLHDNVGYNPFAGREIIGWPETVLLRGRVIVDRGRLTGRPGEGRLLRRAAGPATRPAGRPAPELS
ncbi:MAG: dihydropyrimidinase, partial [Thermohalobaculum sp.]|nr:dihydropyrimidinase [Thermohalobaculum sp.]